METNQPSPESDNKEQATQPQQDTAEEVSSETNAEADITPPGEETPAENTDTQQEATEQSPPASARETELANRMLRMQADIENMHRRHQNALANAHKYGVEKLILELLPVLDSFEMALKNTKKDEHNSAVVEGMELTHKMLLDALGKHGINQIQPQGEVFDPDKHEALSAIPSADHAENTIIEVVQNGYMLADRLLRPAMVIVASKPQKPQDSA